MAEEFGQCPDLEEFGQYPDLCRDGYSRGVIVLVKLMVEVKELVVAHEFGRSDVVIHSIRNGLGVG